MKIKNKLDKITVERKSALLSSLSVNETNPFDEASLGSIRLAYAQSGHSHMKDYLLFDEKEKEVLYPSANALGCSFNPQLAREVAKAVGEDLRAEGVNMAVICAAHPKRNMPLNVNAYYYSEDPYHAMKMSEGYAYGLKTRGVGVCLDGYGLDDYADSRHRNSIVDERAYNELYERGFLILIRRIKPLGIMAPYAKINGIGFAEDASAVEAFRKRTGFAGVVFSPYFGGVDTVKAINAGVLPEMRNDGNITESEITSSVLKGEIPEEKVDSLINRLNTVLKSIYASSKVQFMHDRSVNSILAKNTAEECFVLLKNEGNILPLEKNTKIAIIGKNAIEPFTQIRGRYWVNPTRNDSFVDMASRYAQCKYLGDFDIALLSEDALSAEDTFIVFLGGDNKQSEFENAVSISAAQKDTLRHLRDMGKKIIAVVSSAGSVEMDFSEYADVIIYDPVCGEGSAEALSDIIFGLVSPSGKLNQSLPYSYEDLPSYKYTGEEDNISYKESILSGYRFFTLDGKNAAYPFGHGLTYSAFEYSSERCSYLKNDGNVDVAFDVTNVGTRAAKEVVQIYISDSDKRIFRGGKELRYFEKISLEPGETRRINVRLNTMDFSYYDIDKQEYSFYSAKYNIEIGSSSEDIKIHIPITILSDEMYNAPYSLKDMPSYYPTEGRRLTVANNEFVRICPHAGNVTMTDNGGIGENTSVTEAIKHDKNIQKSIYGLLEELNLMPDKKSKDVVFTPDRFADIRKNLIESMTLGDMRKYYSHKLERPKKASVISEIIFGGDR